MIKIYLQGVNVIVDDGINKEYIPTRASRMEVNPNDDFIVISDFETKYTRSISFDEITNKDGDTFATKQETEDYLTEFVGAFKKGGGGGSDVVTEDELIVVGTELDYNELVANRDPADYLGKYFVTQQGANGVVIFGRRFYGNDAGLYLSNGVSWELRTDIDGSDIIIDTTNLSYSASLQLRDVLEDLDIEITAIQTNLQSEITTRQTQIAQVNTLIAQETQNRINGDTGTVSIHSDISTLLANNVKQVLKWDGISKFIASTLKLNDLDDVNTENVTPEDGWILKYKDGVMIPAMKKNLINKALNIATTNTQLEVQIDEQVNFQRVGQYSFDVRFSHSYDLTSSDFVAFLSVDTEFATDITNGEILRLEPKDSFGTNNDGRGTNQKDVFSQKYFLDIDSVGTKRIVLYFFPSENFTEGSMWDASVVIEEEF